LGPWQRVENPEPHATRRSLEPLARYTRQKWWATCCCRVSHQRCSGASREILNRVGAEDDYRALEAVRSRGTSSVTVHHHLDIRARFAPLFGYLSNSPYRDSFGRPASEYIAADPSLRNDGTSTELSAANRPEPSRLPTPSSSLVGRQLEVAAARVANNPDTWSASSTSRIARKSCASGATSPETHRATARR
jgi:hypothetical protein